MIIFQKNLWGFAYVGFLLYLCVKFEINYSANKRILYI